MFYFRNLCFVNLKSNLTTYTLELGSEIIFLSLDQYFGYFLRKRSDLKTFNSFLRNDSFDKYIIVIGKFGVNTIDKQPRKKLDQEYMGSGSH